MKSGKIKLSNNFFFKRLSTRDFEPMNLSVAPDPIEFMMI